MRSVLIAISLTAGLAAGAAAAQSTFPPSSMTNEPPPGLSQGVNQQLANNTPSDRYDDAVFMLKKKMDRLTREDGGKLTDEHAASLQAELDQLNLRYRGKLARR